MSLRVKPLPLEDVLEVEGIKYSGFLFRSLGDGFQALQPGTVVRILQRKDGVLTIETVKESAP